MAPAPTDVDDGTRNPEREQEEHPKTGGRSVRGRPAFPAPAAPAAPVPIKGNAAAVTAAAVAVGMLREDTSSVGSRGGPSPTINGSPTSSSVQPPRLEEEDGEEEQPPPAAGPGNLSSGISIEELKKMTALRMANQQQQAHLRVVSPFDYGGPAEEGGRPGRPHSRGPSPNQPMATHGARDREMSGGSSGVVDGGGSNYRRGSGFPRATPTGEASPASNGPAEEGGVLRVRPDDDDDVPAALAVPPAPSSTCSGHSSRSGGDGGGSANPKLGGRPVSSKGRNGGGRRKQSPPPAAAPNRGGGGGGSSGSSRASPVSTTSVMAHGLTVQELKELTKIRLAREAFDLPVHSSAAPTASGQQQDSIGGGGGGGSSSGGVPRGRVGSPALSVELGGERRHRRHDSSRSPMHPRSTPSTPGLEDRPHRRTRRGGRRGRNRSPRPDDQYSPRVGDESNHNDGYSSASYSPRPRRSMSDPWADPHDQFPRSSSQPRTVIRDDRDDHPLLSALSREGTSDGYGGGGGGGGARSSHPAGTSGADVEDLGLAGGSRGSGVRGEGSGSLGPGAAAAAAAMAVAATATAAGGGGRGDQLPTRAAHPSLSPSQSATFSRRSPDNGASSGGGGGAGRSSPSMGSTAWEQDFHDRRREDGTGAAGGGRGTVVGAGVAEDFQHHHGEGSRGRDRDREARPERGAGAALSGERPRSLHHLDRRHLGEGERRQFPAEAEQVHLRERGAGGALHVHGMIGNERLTSLRGFKDPSVGPPAHPQHDHRHLDHHHHQQQQQQQQQASPYFLRAQRSNSEGLPRPSAQQQQQQHQQQQQQHQRQQHHNYLRVGSSTGSANGNRLPLRAQQDASRMGDRHHSHHYQQQQQQQQVHPHRRYASDSSYQHGPPPAQQHHHAASHGGFPGAGAAGGGGSWAGGGSGARYFPPHGGAGGPQLVSRKSDGGGVVISSAAYHPQGGQGVGVGGGVGGNPTGMAGAGGVRHGSSTSLADGDISYNVAESVLVTPRKDPGGSWKSSSSGSSGSGGSGKNNGVNAQYAVPAPAPSWREYQAGRAQQQQQQRPQVATARQFAADGRSGAEAMGGRVAGRPDYPSHLHGINAASSGGASGPRGMGRRFDSSMPSSRRRGSHEENGMMPIMSNHHHGSSNSQAGPFAPARRSSGSGGIGGGSAHASPSLPAHRQSPPMPPSGGLHGFQAGSGGALSNALHRGPPSSSNSLSFSPAFGGMRGDAQPVGGPGLNDNAVGAREGGSDGGVGGRGSPLSSGSPLMAGLSFSLDLAGYNGGAGGAGGRLVGRAGSEGALSAHSNAVDFFPKARDGATASNGGGGGGGGVSASAGAAGAGAGGRGFASGLFGFDTGRGAGGGGMGASPSSHHSAGPMDSSTMPRQLDIGPSSLSGGGGMGPTDPPLLADTGSLFSSFGQGGSGSVGGGGGVDVMSFPGARQTRSASSPSIAVGRERNGSAIAAIGSSRNNSAHSSPSMAGVSGISGNGNGNRNGGTPPSTSSGMGVDANLEFSLLNISGGDGGGGGGSAGLDAFGAQKTVYS